jgi:hypothetical protein
MASDSEHFEKQHKEFSKWIDDLCRECHHKRLFHLGSAAAKKGEKYLHGNCNMILKMGGFCSCLEWMPKDNLDYIELLAKRKGLIPDEENE